jgi:hypothetical protein
MPEPAADEVLLRVAAAVLAGLRGGALANVDHARFFPVTPRTP